MIKSAISIGVKLPRGINLVEESASGAMMVIAGSMVMRLVRSVRCSNGAAGEGSIITRVVIMTSNRRDMSARFKRNGSDLRVPLTFIVVIALRAFSTKALGMAVRRAGAEGFLLLVFAAEAELEKSGNKEEQSAEDGDSEAGSVETTRCAKRRGIGNLPTLAVAAKALSGARRSVAERTAYVARAFVGAIAGEDDNRDHGTAAEEVEEYCEQSENSLV